MFTEAHASGSDGSQVPSSLKTRELQADAIKKPAAVAFPSRPRAVTHVIGAVIALALGSVLYAVFAPSLDILHVELAGRTQLRETSPTIVVRHADVTKAVWWDFVFIAGYGTALGIGAVATKWVFWTDPARRIAAFAPIAAAVTVGADLVENIFLLISSAHPKQSGNWLDAASAAAVLKFSALIPAALIAVVAVAVTVSRAISWTFISERWQQAPENSGPLPIAGRPVEAPPAKGASRWRDGYNTPDPDPALITEKFRNGEPTVGFCVSGGGIRAACVAMGALQSLRPRLLQSRYLVSVSGGGYTAGALQQILTTAPDAPQTPRDSASGDEAEVEAEAEAGDETEARDETTTDELIREVVRNPIYAFGDGSAEQDHVRRHSSYLADTPAEILSALGRVARGLIASLAVLFAPAVLLGALVGIAYHLIPITDLCRRQNPSGPCRVRVHWGVKNADIPFPTPRPGSVWLLAALVVAALAVWIAGLIWKSFQDYAKPGERRRRRVDAVGAAFVQAALFLAFVTLALPALVWATARLFSGTARVPQLTGGGVVLTFLLTYGSALASFGQRGAKLGKRVTGLVPKKKDGTSSRGAGTPTSVVQILLVIVTLLLLATTWLLLFAGVAAALPTRPLHDRTVWWVLAGAAAVVVTLGVLLDETELSLHPFYRQRLATAFAVRTVRYRPRSTTKSGQPSGEQVGRTVVEPYEYDEWTTLSKYGAKVDGFPQVIFAAAANINGEKRTAPGLNAVSFTMSGDWVGSPDLGWLPTDYIERLAKGLNRDLTVQAAVAISGAAFSSAMGRASRWYETMLAISGARLGTWLPNPTFVIMRHNEALQGNWTIPGLPRIRRLPYLLREVLNIHPYQERLVQVTDGGHYDNLGLVELLRRRCTQIFCIDASGDSPPTASTLAEAIRLAHDELGVVITLEDPLNLEPGKGTPLDPNEPLKNLNERLSRTPVVRARITYPPQAGLGKDVVGQLVFAKAMLWPEMPYPLVSYSVKQGIFPHDSTGDQWFDEGKFSAYTQLGRSVGELAERAARGLPIVRGDQPRGSTADGHARHPIDSWRVHS